MDKSGRDCFGKASQEKKREYNFTQRPRSSQRIQATTGSFLCVLLCKVVQKMTYRPKFSAAVYPP